MKRKQILFIGAINKGDKPTGGAEAKNQILFKKLNRDYSQGLSFIDMSQLRFLRYFQLIISLFIYDRIVLSIASTALEKLSFFNFILNSKRVTIFVIGGVVDEKLTIPRLRNLFENAEFVYAETQDLERKINRKSTAINVKYLPNFKEIPEINIIERSFEGKIKLVYLSRIHRDKGIFRCFDLVERLNKVDNHREYTLDVFGNFDLSNPEEDEFYKYIDQNKYLRYKGFLDLDSQQGYQELANYHFFLFLTNHPGEGFPGVLIDAMIAGVPIIASDWKYNAEILNNGKAVLGEIIDLRNDYISKASKSILGLVSCQNKYQEIQSRMQKEARSYDIENLSIEIA